MSRRKTVLSCWAGNARYLTGGCWVERRVLRLCLVLWPGSAARHHHSCNRLGVIADNGGGARL
jgi:hypothetical protein